MQQYTQRMCVRVRACPCVSVCVVWSRLKCELKVDASGVCRCVCVVCWALVLQDVQLGHREIKTHWHFSGQQRKPVERFSINSRGLCCIKCGCEGRVSLFMLHLSDHADKCEGLGWRHLDNVSLFFFLHTIYPLTSVIPTRTGAPPQSTAAAMSLIC